MPEKIQRVKRPVVLLEILISLSLLAILLTCLFSSLVKMAQVNQKIETARSAIFSREHLHMRLQDLFMSLSKSASTPFYTALFPEERQESLVLTFDNGIDPDPAFSGEVLARIFIDKEKNLSLAIWPLEKETSWRKEILLPQIKDFHFEFLGMKKDRTVRALDANVAWHDHWSKERGDFPMMIRLMIDDKKGGLCYAFPLPSADHLITYFGGGPAL